MEIPKMASQTKSDFLQEVPMQNALDPRIRKTTTISYKRIRQVQLQQTKKDVYQRVP